MDPPSNLSVDYFNSLPDELLIEILVKTDDLKTLSRWCRTSKRINRICQDEFFWHRKYQRDFGFSSRGNWGLSGNIILMEGDTWKELYKQMSLTSINSPISAGGISYGVIDQNGNLYMTGMKNLLGIGKQSQIGPFPKGSHLVKFPSKDNNSDRLSQKVISISVGMLMVGAVTADGRAYFWGYDEIGMFGSSDRSRIIFSPREMNLPTLRDGALHKSVGFITLRGKAKRIEVSQLGYIVLLEDSSVCVNIYKKNKIDFRGSLDLKAIDISIGQRIYAIITKDHKLYVGGDIFVDKLNDHNELIPLRFPEPVIRVIATGGPIVVLSTTGTVYILNSREGILSAIHGDISPILVKLPEMIVQISACGGTFAVVSKTGKLYMWGSNSHSKISSDEQNLAILSQGEYSYRPNEISFGLPINFVSVGGDFTIAISDDGFVNYWGNPERNP